MEYLKDNWISEQLQLKEQCSLEDTESLLEKLRKGTLLIGGLDISYSNEENSIAIVGISVVKIGCEDNGFNPHTLSVDCFRVGVEVPYIPNFLAFREVPAYLKAIHEFEIGHPHLKPDVFMLDGNGTLHTRQFGAACHLGVLLEKPCFGVAKSLPCLDAKANNLPMEAGLKQRKIIEERINNLDDDNILYLYGATETVDGAAILTGVSKKPLYISPGHLITLQTAVEITRRCTIHRIPEPTRQADIRSREALSELS